MLVAELECIADRTSAEGMCGVLVGAPRAALPPTAADEYYWTDLVGLEVVNTRDQALGRKMCIRDRSKVVLVIRLPAKEVCVVKRS